MTSRRTAFIAAAATLAGVGMIIALNYSTSEDQGSRMLAGNACKETDDDPYAPIREPIFSGVVDVGNLVGATILLLVLGALAAGAGIGGGGLFVPIFAFILLDQNAKAAVPLSKACILGGAIGNFVTLGWARHPDEATKGVARPMIDYEASTFMQSGELLGVIFGVLLNILLPEIWIIVFLVGLLSFNAYRTLKKGIAKYNAETEKMKKEAASPEETKEAPAETGDVEMKNVPDDKESADKTEVSTEEAPKEDGAVSTALTTSGPSEESSLDAESAPTAQETAADKAAELARVKEEYSKQFPFWAYAIIIPMTAYTAVYAILKKEVITPCASESAMGSTAGYWLWYFSPVLVLGGAMVLTAKVLHASHKAREAAGFPYIHELDDNGDTDYKDIQWTPETLAKFPKIALLAGVAAGLLGIGGGMVIGPLFMEIEMQPKVGSSSCAFMILWTATSGVIQYMAADKLGWEFALYFICFGFVSGQVGQKGVDKVIEQSGRKSFVILLLGSIIAVACISMTGTGIYKIVDKLSNGYTIEDLTLSFTTCDFVCGN